MPKKIPLHTIIVYRDGKNVSLPIGEAFAFTDDEVAEIEKSSPGALRDPINEVAATEAKPSGKGKSAASESL